MADVACFCGYVFSFGGDAGACPGCGEVAVLRYRHVPEGAASCEPDNPLLITDIWQDAQMPLSWPDLDDTVELSAIDARVIPSPLTPR